MLLLMDIWDSVRGFMATGGDVLWLVAAVLFAMWVLMIERYWYLTLISPKEHQAIIALWNAREDSTSWYAHRIREAWISQAQQDLRARMLFIKTLVAICPMIGLLGTVTGMISVFEVMAVHGTSNARMMAAGIAMATMPTMAGMVAALSGVFFSTRLDAKMKLSIARLNSHGDVGRLTTQGEHSKDKSMGGISMCPMQEFCTKHVMSLLCNLGFFISVCFFLPALTFAIHCNSCVI